MHQTSHLDQRMNIVTVVWPIFVEQLLRTSIMTIDVLMLSQYSDDAVAAVGLTGNFILFVIFMHMIVSTGAAILIGQHLGAQQAEQGQAYAEAGLALSFLMSIAVGALFFFGSTHLVALYNLEPMVEQFAFEYTFITGTFSIGMGISILLSTVLRAYGYSKSPMVIQVMSGLLNVVGNYIALFGPFGLPVTGVAGVAVATVLSQVFAALACVFVLKKYRLPFSVRSAFRYNRRHLADILRLGLPNAGEGLSYNFAQITIMFFVAQLGTAALVATAIAQTIARFIFVFSLSLGIGSQIISSYLVGQNRIQELKASIHRHWIIGVMVSVAVSLLFIVAREPLASIFSQDPEAQKLIGLLLIMWLFLEPGRAVNLIVISSLKGTGDVMFPVKVGIICMWGIGVLFAYIIGIHWSFGVLGIWFAVGLDEWVRGTIMILRWQSEKWVGKSRLS